jgi:arabinogalactan oligomer/maltooligosaccharide transport system substrate-binding protein
MYRTRKFAALAAVLALGLAACSSGDDGADGGDVSGWLLIWADEKRAGPIGDLAQQWGEENGVTVEVTQINYEDIRAQYVQQAPAGQGPDILLGGNDWVGEFSDSGLISPVDLGDNADKFVESALNGWNVDGQNYAVPIAVENVVLFRNTDLAPETPATIEAMAQSGLALQAQGKTQYPIGIQVGDKGDAYHAYPFYSGAGGYFYPLDNGVFDTGDLGVGEEGSLTFAKGWAALGAEGAIKSTFVGDDLINAWSSGQLAYWITGPWNIPIVKDSGVNFEVEPVPGWEGAPAPAVPIVGTQGFYLNSFSENKSTAQAFLDATMNTEFMNAIYDADPRPPAWKESDASSDPIIKAILAYGEGGYPNLFPNSAVIYEELGLAQTKILDGADPVATMEAARTNIENRTGATS